MLTFRQRTSSFHKVPDAVIPIGYAMAPCGQLRIHPPGDTITWSLARRRSRPRAQSSARAKQKIGKTPIGVPSPHNLMVAMQILNLFKQLT
jgi:hypothetical protein